MSNPSLLYLLSKSHDQSCRMGWWSDCPEPENPARKWYITTKLCLIHSEIDEAASLGMDDHLPHRTAFEVELADTVIRSLDMIGFMVGYSQQDASLHVGVIPSNTSTECLLMDLHGYVSSAMEHYRKGREVSMCGELCKLIATVEAAQQAFHINVYEAAIDKLAYNARRADHQLVNRQAAGGKSF